MILEKNLKEEIFDSKCSFYFGKRTMSMSVELKQITEEIAKKLL